MLTRDSSARDAWGDDIDWENSTCEDCGRSTVGRFGRQPWALCDSCQSDEDRIIADPNTVWMTDAPAAVSGPAGTE